MSKMDISISRSATISTGNYSSIKPSITLTLKDIDEESLDTDYERLSCLADALLASEIMSLGDEMTTISDVGFKSYLNSLKKLETQIKGEIMKFVRKGII